MVPGQPPFKGQTLDVNNPVFAALDRMSIDLRSETATKATIDVVVASSTVLSAGYVLLNTKFVYWFLSALTARPAVWRRLDPIDVLYAWDQEHSENEMAGEGSIESLQSLVG